MQLYRFLEPRKQSVHQRIMLGIMRQTVLTHLQNFLETSDMAMTPTS